jgi:alpha-beta hydrolase superfamily lysophospholipase
MRNTLARFFRAVCFVYAVYTVYHAYHRCISRMETSFEFFRRVLLSPSLLPFTSEETPRLCMFSHEDKVVESADIEDHVAEARNAGFRVEVEVFKNSPHVSHMRLDPERYWGATRAFWSSVLDRRETGNTLEAGSK